MAKVMLKADWLARAQAFDEAAEHLGLDWTDEPLERQQGEIAAEKIRKHADRCRQIASTIKF